VIAWLDAGGPIDSVFTTPDATVRDISLLMIACGHGNEPLAKALLARNADANMQNSYGGCALMGAAAEGHAQIVSLLMSASGINSGLKDGNGDTALELAQRNQHDDCAKALKGGSSWF